MQHRERILQIGVHQNYRFAGRIFEAGGGRCLMAKISAQMDDMDAGIATGPLDQLEQRLVKAAIVDQHHFDGAFDFRKETG